MSGISRNDHYPICEICGSSNLSYFDASEQMYGMGGKFTYIACKDCEVIYQPEKLPDYSAYYPDGYYSFEMKNNHQSFSKRLKAYKKRERDKYYFFKHGLMGKLLSVAKPSADFHISNQMSFESGMKILDVGCGSGAFIHELAEIGIKNVYGVDPYIPRSVKYENGVKIFKGDLGQLFAEEPFGPELSFDLIRLSHSFEHFTNPLTMLELAKRLLNPNGRILINTPLADSYAAKKYGEYWAQLDAPRHIYLFSKKSMQIISGKVGLRIEKTFFDSSDFQFWGSEQYMRGISLFAENSLEVSRRKSIFSKNQLRNFKLEAKRLNSLALGDQAGFILVNG